RAGRRSGYCAAPCPGVQCGWSCLQSKGAPAMVSRALIAALVLIAGSAFPATVHARHAGSRFTVNVTIAPARTVEGATVTLQAHTRIGSMCVATVLYDDGRHSPRLAHAEQHVGQSGIVRWRWQVATASRGGAASVICIFKGQVRLGVARFT